jgi:hypothetical protein
MNFNAYVDKDGMIQRIAAPAVIPHFLYVELANERGYPPSITEQKQKYFDYYSVELVSPDWIKNDWRAYKTGP